MKTSTIIWLVIAAILLLLGLIVLILGLISSQNARWETRTVDISGSFNRLDLTTETGSIRLVRTDGTAARVVFHDRNGMRHWANLQGDTLKVGVQNERKWYDRFDLFSRETPSVTVYLPRERYAALTATATTGNVTIPAGFSFDSITLTATTGNLQCGALCMGPLVMSVTTGDIEARSISAGSMDIHATTGDITLGAITCGGEVKVKTSTGKQALSGVNCAALTTQCTTGGTVLKNVIVQNVMNLTCSTGSIKMERCDAGEIHATTSTGSITGSLLSPKVFSAQTGTGKVNVPQSTTGGICRLSTGTGDIRITLE